MKRAPADQATAYARAVIAGKILAGKPVRLACQRHLNDLERDDLTWDLAAAQRAIGYFRDVLRLNGGDFEGKPFILEPWQAFIVGCLFGWKDRDGYRRFRVAFNEIGKGSGKSPLAAGIGLLMQTADGERRAEVYAAATKKDQAMILFRDAVAMRDQSPQLKKRLKTSGGKGQEWSLADLTTGSFFRPIASDSAQSGPRVHCGLLDEVHEHPNATVWDMMRAGTKGRRQALIFGITNSGWDRSSLCFHLHEYSIKVLEGTLEDDSWFAYIASLDVCEACAAKGKTSPSADCSACDDWTDESVWIKANPNLGVSITLKYLREQVREAKGMPTKENNVRRLNFCQWTEQETIWISADAWKAAENPNLVAEALRGRDCFAGLDLASTNDTAAAGLLFPPREPGERWKSLEFYWCPEATIVERSMDGRVPYNIWANAGYIRTTPGNRIDYAFIRRDLNQLRADYEWNFIEVPYDPHGGTQLSTELMDDGFVMVPMVQSIAMFSPAMKEFERGVVGVHDDSTGVRVRHYEHATNPVTAWQMGNVVPRIDARSDVRPDRDRSRDKIDGPVALQMARNRASLHSGGGTSIYEEQGMTVV